MSGFYLKKPSPSSPKNINNCNIAQFYLINFMCTCMLVITLPRAVVAWPVKRCPVAVEFVYFDFMCQSLCISIHALNTI